MIKILHSSSENEEVKGAKPILGLLGLFAIPMGVILFNITAVIDGLKTISMLFLVISLIGGYLLTAQITTIGTLVKRFFPKAYRKNILFYNLVAAERKSIYLILICFFFTNRTDCFFQSALTGVVFWSFIIK